MPTEPLPHAQAVHEYAEAHGLAYLWEGAPGFEKRLRTLSPGQYQLMAVHTRKGMKRVLLFSKTILQAEFDADKPQRDAIAAKRVKSRLAREAKEKRAAERAAKARK